jgi:sulfur-oxidizing protein SoxY
MERRNLLKLFASSAVFLTGLIKPLVALAKWNQAAFDATNYDDAIEHYFPGASFEDTDKITIGVHSEIENGAVVPIKVKTELKKLESITILVEKNPTALIANFDLYPGCLGNVSTRIKMEVPSDIIVIVKSDGKYYKTKKFVVVHEGGCG